MTGKIITLISSNLSFSPSKIIALASLVAFCLFAAPPVMAKKKNDAGAAKTSLAPSENHGKTGTYQVKTSNPSYSYYVYVPKTYSEKNPAGLHLFFHGMSDQHSASNFGRISGAFLEKYNLIAIGMCFDDMKLGSQCADIDGKVAAARNALAQVMADYKIIAGKGVISCFSGGGGMVQAMIDKYGGAKSYDAEWPFCHAGIYSANYNFPPRNPIPMTWYVSCGQGEWNYMSVPLGQGQSRLYGSLLGDSMKKGGNSDVCFHMIKGKMHDVNPAEIERSSEQFRRGNLAYAPFIYAPDFPDKKLSNFVAMANKLQLGAAHKGLKTILQIASSPAEQKAAAEEVQRLLDERVNGIFQLATEMAADDLILLNFYGPIFLKQLEGHPRKKEMQDLITAAQRSPKFASALSAQKRFVEGYPFVDERTGALFTEKVAELKFILGAAGEKSMIGKIAADYLSLQ